MLADEFLQTFAGNIVNTSQGEEKRISILDENSDELLVKPGLIAVSGIGETAIPTHKSETGFSFSDHSYELPNKLTLNFAADNDLFDAFDQKRKKVEPVTVVTPIGVYDNMYITKSPFTITAGVTNRFPLQVELQEHVFQDATITSLPPRKVINKKRHASTVDKGKINKSQNPNAKEKAADNKASSALYELFN